MDGGVRQGTDVLKALALGARAVFIGRPAVWGLAYNVSTDCSCMMCVWGGGGFIHANIIFYMVCTV